MFRVYVDVFLVISSSAFDCLERLASEMTCCASSLTLNLVYVCLYVCYQHKLVMSAYEVRIFAPGQLSLFTAG